MKNEGETMTREEGGWGGEGWIGGEGGLERVEGEKMKKFEEEKR